jgi:hypothetical protein
LSLIQIWKLIGAWWYPAWVDRQVESGKYWWKTSSWAFPEDFGIFFKLIDHLYMLQAGLVKTGLDVLGVLDLIELVTAPLESLGNGNLLEVPDLLLAVVSLFLEAGEVHGLDDVDV